MRLLGLEIGRAKAAPPAGAQAVTASGRGLWDMFVVREPWAGAWQRNEELRLDSALANSALFRCVSLISGDIAKMRCRLMQKDANGIWAETESNAFSPVLRKPNGYQTRIQFYQSWMASKLNAGNTYVLKERDARGVVVALHVLDPTRMTPLITPDGAVWYQPKADWLAGLEQSDFAIPASEIIHDRWNTFFHPLVGLSPVYACGLAALQGVTAQRHATSFFKNGAKPGGVLTSPRSMTDDQVANLSAKWAELFTGDKAGKTAVLANGMEYKPLSVSADDSKLIETLKWSDETVCGCFGVPPYMAGVGSAPLNNNVETLAELYYAQCLQIHIESIELCLDEGLGLIAAGYGAEFDLTDLLRMDQATQIKALGEGVQRGILAPNEARRDLNRPPVPGGDTPYLQQQNFSLAALDKRDTGEDPFGLAAKADSAFPPPAANDDKAEELAEANIRAARAEARVQELEARAFVSDLERALEGELANAAGW